jgi:hypothetical protein
MLNKLTPIFFPSSLLETELGTLRLQNRIRSITDLVLGLLRIDASPPQFGGETLVFLLPWH